MPKNRDYTGLVRTPSSMAWLITQRSIVQGQIDKITKQLEQLPARLVRLRTDLAALDAVIPLHEVKVDPKEITGKRPYAPRLVPRGEMGRHILRELKTTPQGVLTTIELAMSLAREFNLPVTDRKARSLLIERVQKRCRTLADEGFLKRHHSKSNFELGVWSLARRQIEAQHLKAA